MSLYLSLTALSSLFSSYFGGYLLNFLTTPQMFIATSIFSLMTLVSGIIVTEKNDRVDKKKEAPRKPCELAKKNWGRVWQFLKLPFIYLPTIFIFLVVVAPGNEDAMFYFNTNILKFTADELAISNVLCSVANIAGVWAYRFFFKNTPFKKMIVLTTILFSIA